MIGSYFNNIFEASNLDCGRLDFLDVVHPIISEQQNSMLTETFELEEFTMAIKQMHGDKAPGPDGFNPAFYHKCWSLVKKEVFVSCVRWLH